MDCWKKNTYKNKSEEADTYDARSHAELYKYGHTESILN